MKTRNFLLGLVEGVVFSLIVLLTILIRRYLRAECDIEIPSEMFLFVSAVSSMAAVMVISNNVHKLVFVQKFVTARDRTFEGVGVFLSFVLLFLTQFLLLR